MFNYHHGINCNYWGFERALLKTAPNDLKTSGTLSTLSKAVQDGSKNGTQSKQTSSSIKLDEELYTQTMLKWAF